MELALVLPIMLLLVVSVAELGLVFGASQSLVYASREGARVGSALGKGVHDVRARGDPVAGGRPDRRRRAAHPEVARTPA